MNNQWPSDAEHQVIIKAGSLCQSFFRSKPFPLDIEIALAPNSAPILLSKQLQTPLEKQNYSLVLADLVSFEERALEMQPATGWKIIGLLTPVVQYSEFDANYHQIPRSLRASFVLENDGVMHSFHLFYFQFLSDLHWFMGA